MAVSALDSPSSASCPHAVERLGTEGDSCLAGQPTSAVLPVPPLVVLSGQKLAFPVLYRATLSCTLATVAPHRVACTIDKTYIVKLTTKIFIRAVRA